MSKVPIGYLVTALTDGNHINITVQLRSSGPVITVKKVAAGKEKELVADEDHLKWIFVADHVLLTEDTEKVARRIWALFAAYEVGEAHVTHLFAKPSPIATASRVPHETYMFDIETARSMASRLVKAVGETRTIQLRLENGEFIF